LNKNDKKAIEDQKPKPSFPMNSENYMQEASKPKFDAIQPNINSTFDKKPEEPKPSTLFSKPAQSYTLAPKGGLFSKPDSNAFA
jgi:hypothetical protein